MRLPFELRGGALLAINTFAILLLAFPVQVMVARYLGPEQLGVYTYILSYAALARVFVNVGLPDALVPLYQRERDDRLFGGGWLLRQVAALLMTLTGLAYSLSQIQHPHNYQTGLLITLAVAAYQLSDHELYSIWCKATGRFSQYVLIDFGGTMVGLGLRLAVVYSAGTMTQLIWSYFVEQAAKLVLAATLYLGTGRPFLKPFRYSPTQVGLIFRQAWPIWAAALLTAAYARVDQLLLGSLLPDPSQLGQYAVATRILEALQAGSVALFVVYLPILAAQAPANLPAQLQRYTDLAWWTSLALCLPLALLVQPLVLWMYGHRYAEAARLSSYALAALPALHLGHCRTAYAYACGLQKLELALKALSLMVSFALNFWAVPRYGALGSVWVSLVVQWGTLLVAYLGLSPYRPAAACVWRSLQPLGSFTRFRSWLA
ncbi:oligosaccharide flippase family protein [bacterium]|nr:oligosaccharide flippase family protein [bacterium]